MWDRALGSYNLYIDYIHIYIHIRPQTGPDRDRTLSPVRGLTSQCLLDVAIEGRYGTTAEVQQRHSLLSQEWETYRIHVLDGNLDPRGLRKEGVELSEKCALLARISCGSAGVLKSHPLGRLIRESWQYTVAGYSQEQVQSYLESV